jgi:hypothetical protein
MIAAAPDGLVRSGSSGGRKRLREGLRIECAALETDDALCPTVRRKQFVTFE